MPNFRKGADAAENKPDIIVGPPFTARFDSDCGDCGFGIDEGETVRMVENPAGTQATATCLSCVKEIKARAERSGLRISWESNR